MQIILNYFKNMTDDQKKIYEFENQEWLDSFDYIINNEEEFRPQEILELLKNRAIERGVKLDLSVVTQLINSIHHSKEVEYGGNREIERKIKSIIRWNAMAMVVRANRKQEGIGGHLSTYASAATLYEVGFNHFFRGGDSNTPADMVYFQGHASPGIYARSFIEGRLSEANLENFRRELDPKGGLSSYPHPRLMEDYWQFPTVSMGLGPITAIYQARFIKYLQGNKLIADNDQKVWAFLGDGEMDEPESLGALTIASREELDNLTFVVNCNLQRLDGPVRGNGSIVQELEGSFRGAGWNVIKVMWGSNWDALLDKDDKGLLKKRLTEIVDGQRQKLSIEEGDYIRKEFFGKSEDLLEIVSDLSDDEIASLSRGGHDPQKVFNAYKVASEHKGQPTVILAQTVKGYGLGEVGEGKNSTHQQKKLTNAEIKQFRDRFNIPVSDEDVNDVPFVKLEEGSEEMEYLLNQRKNLGGSLPKRNSKTPDFIMPDKKSFDDLLQGTGDREAPTTGAAVQLMAKLLKDKNVGNLIVPIIPDESRTFGIDALFSQVGIYSPKGQLYEPVDRDSLMYYKEAKDGAILEEGINESGAMASFIAAGTAYSNHGVNTIPFYIFYSMFGFQRTADLIWLAADARCKGFMLGATAGRTTLAGEGLQHQDGQSHLFALSVPAVQAYDPAFAYEVATIIEDGIKRMYKDGEDIFYYITVMNEKYKMPKMPTTKGIKEGILNGMYKYKASKSNKFNVNLLGSGTILNEVINASEILKKDYDIDSDVWSVTSYKRLYENALETDRVNRLKDKKSKTFIEECVGSKDGLFVAASDYMKALPLSVSKWFPGNMIALGTDGYGLSEDRVELREYFEVNANHIVWSTLQSLKADGKISSSVLSKAKKKLNIETTKGSAANIN